MWGGRSGCSLPPTLCAADSFSWLRTGSCLKKTPNQNHKINKQNPSETSSSWEWLGLTLSPGWSLKENKAATILRPWANLVSSVLFPAPKAGCNFTECMDRPGGMKCQKRERKQAFLSFLELSQLSLWRCVSNSVEGSLQLLYFIFYSPFENLMKLCNPLKFNMPFPEVLFLSPLVTYLLQWAILGASQLPLRQVELVVASRQWSLIKVYMLFSAIQEVKLHSQLLSVLGAQEVVFWGGEGRARLLQNEEENGSEERMDGWRELEILT